MKQLVVHFDQREYESTHGRQPRGPGNWAFCPRRHYNGDNYMAHVLWITAGFGEAKKRAAEHYRRNGETDIIVCT